MKVIIAGGRDFTDYELLKRECDKILGSREVTIISGNADGVDKLGERYARERKHSLIICPANWDRYGKAAGHLRNKQMAHIANGIIAFWDGKSSGTKSMISFGEALSLPVIIINY